MRHTTGRCRTGPRRSARIAAAITAAAGTASAAAFTALAIGLCAPRTLSAQAAEHGTNPRFGVWLLESDAPAPARNVMTYEAWGDGGMRITVASTNAEGRKSEWGYVTQFDGVFRPVEGQENAETAVEVVDDHTTRISNRRDGRVYQVIINTLSDDLNTIQNEYVRFDDEGRITRVGHATYRRIS